MAIVNTVSQIIPGMGSTALLIQRVGVVTNTGATTIVLPAAGTFAAPTATTGMTVQGSAPSISKGKIRVKTNTIGVNSTSIITSITGTDGTTTVNLYGGDTAASAAGVGIDHVVEFLTDLNLTSISVVVTIATNNCTVDIEMAGVN